MVDLCIPIDGRSFWYITLKNIADQFLYELLEILPLENDYIVVDYSIVPAAINPSR